nr:response regulator transcription factor [Zoogloeaceae bacterium]
MSQRQPVLVHVIEDDSSIGRQICDTLEKFAYRTELFQTGSEFLRHLGVEAPSLCILDLGLPDLDGMEVMQRMRRTHRFGVLIVTGRTDTSDRVLGLELGADDYVTKPFEARELIARVRSILRRYTPQAFEHDRPEISIARFAGWQFEVRTYRLTSPDGHEETLGQAEAQLLLTLLERPNQILSREQLLSGRDVSALDRSIDLRISRLRRRFEENPQHAKLIKTVYGAGYLFSAVVNWG